MRRILESRRLVHIAVDAVTALSVVRYVPCVDSVRAMSSAPEMVRAQHLSYSVRLTSEIARDFNATVDEDRMVAAAAMVDAFYVHIRLLAEFLTRPVRRGDIGPADFEVDWSKPDSPQAQRLDEYWEVASKHVVHLGGPRLDPAGRWVRHRFVVGASPFEAMTRDALMVYAGFLRQVRAAHPPVPAIEPIPDHTIEPDAWRMRLLADRSEYMTGEFLDACARVGWDGQALLTG